MADLYLSGITGFVRGAPGFTPGGIVYPFAKWTLDCKVGKPKVTNFTTLGFQALVRGIKSATMNLEGAYNFGNMPLTHGELYSFQFGYFGGVYIAGSFVVDLRLTNDVEDKPMVYVSGESTGAFGFSIL